jgi:hypothetical protein
MGRAGKILALKDPCREIVKKILNPKRLAVRLNKQGGVKPESRSGGSMIA